MDKSGARAWHALNVEYQRARLECFLSQSGLYFLATRSGKPLKRRGSCKELAGLRLASDKVAISPRWFSIR